MNPTSSEPRDRPTILTAPRSRCFWRRTEEQSGGLGPLNKGHVQVFRSSIFLPPSIFLPASYTPAVVRQVEGRVKLRGVGRLSSNSLLMSSTSCPRLGRRRDGKTAKPPALLQLGTVTWDSRTHLKVFIMMIKCPKNRR